MCLSVCLFVCVSVVCLSDIYRLSIGLSLARAPAVRCKGCTFTHLDFVFQFFAEHSLFMHRVGHRDTVSLFSTECNMTAGVGIPQVDTRQICPSSLHTTSRF